MTLPPTIAIGVIAAVASKLVLFRQLSRVCRHTRSLPDCTVVGQFRPGGARAEISWRGDPL
jgi:hypothetical protein